jgi:hypothetical protein
MEFASAPRERGSRVHGVCAAAWISCNASGIDRKAIQFGERRVSAAVSFRRAAFGSPLAGLKPCVSVALCLGGLAFATKVAAALAPNPHA